MPVLTTSRLICSPLQDHDWPFFLALQHDPEVMRFVAEDRPVEAIREAFDSRLTPGRRAARTGFASLCVTPPPAYRSASPVIFIAMTIARKWVFFLHLRPRGKVTASNRCRRCAVTPFIRAAYAASPPPSRRGISPPDACWKKRAFVWRASYARVITLADNGIMTGCSVY